MIALTLRQMDAEAETFADMELLIYDTIHKFVRQYGGSYDDYADTVGTSFIRAYRTHDRKRSKFSSRLRQIVWYDCLELRRQRAKHGAKVLFTELDAEQHQAPRSFDLGGFLEDVGEDARLVLQAVFETPWQYEPEPKQIRSLLRDYFKQPAIGWTSERINESFNEIREALRR